MSRRKKDGYLRSSGKFRGAFARPVGNVPVAASAAGRVCAAAAAAELRWCNGLDWRSECNDQSTISLLRDRSTAQPSSATVPALNKFYSASSSCDDAVEQKCGIRLRGFVHGASGVRVPARHCHRGHLRGGTLLRSSVRELRVNRRIIEGLSVLFSPHQSP